MTNPLNNALTAIDYIKERYGTVNKIDLSTIADSGTYKPYQSKGGE